MSLDCLPAELLLSVMSYLDCPKDRSAFTRTSRRYHCSLNRELFILSIVELDFWGIFWAARTGNLPTLKGFLDAAKPAFHMAPVGSDLEWRPVWEFWPSWGARFQGNLFQRIPVFNYRGHCWYHGNTHIPIFCLYREALIEAAMHGQVKTFQLLAGQIPWYLHEIDYYESNDGGRWYALSHLAAFYNQPEIMELLVNDGVNLMAGFPEQVPEDTPSPLHIACRDGYVEIVKLLLRQGVNPDVPDSNGVTPLILATSWGNRDIVEVLLDYGANPYQTFRSCSTLCVATGYAESYVLEGLLKAGLSADGFDANGNLQPMIGNHTREFRTGEMREYWPESIHRTTYCTPLAFAAFLDQADCARILLENGAKPNFVEPNGEMPLHIALENGNLKTASILIQNGARLDMVDGLGKTAMHYALLPVGSSWEVLETLKFLIDNGTPEITAESMSRVLEYWHSHPGVSLPPCIITAREAISGQSPQCEDCDAHRPCHQIHNDDSFYQRLYEPGSIRCHCAKMVELFLDRGVDVNAYDSLGRTLLHRAAYWSCTDTIELIILRGGDLHAHDAFSQTPLHQIMVHPPHIPHRLCRILRILLSQGADPNSKDENGQTPLHLAAQVGNLGAIGAMLEWAQESGDAKYGDRNDAAAMESRYLDVAGVDNSGRNPFHLLATNFDCLPESTGVFLFLLSKVGGGCACTAVDGESRCQYLQRLFRTQA